MLWDSGSDRSLFSWDLGCQGGCLSEIVVARCLGAGTGL